MTITEQASRSAYVVRVNIHNADWDGSICANPTRHDDCRARLGFKSGYCAAGISRCFFLSLFERSAPRIKLPKSQHPYEAVFGRQRPRAGDLVIFWGTYADDRDFPVGCWEVRSFDDTESADYVLLGDPSTIVMFTPRTAEYGIVSTRVSRSLGGEMIRLLSSDSVHPVMQRWVDDHQSELARRTRLGQNTDDTRDALEGLRRVVGVLPQSNTEHLTHRPFEGINLGLDDVVDVAEAAVVVEESNALTRERIPLVTLVGERRDALAGFPASLVADYRVALEVSTLVVLAGPSGAGKTKLTSAFAGATRAEYLIVPVRPDWRTNEDLLGYLPPFNENFVPTAFTEFVSRAAEEWLAAVEAGRSAVRFHVCLDEMNLARPEYYMAELLSRMELQGDERQISLYDAPEDRGYPRRLLLPPNLSIIGTVNNDDTTHALSPKLIDRAVYLNVDVIDLEQWFANRSEKLARTVGPYVVELDARISPTGMRIGYRAADQVLRWIAHSKMNGIDDYEALDAALATLVIPRLRVQRAEKAHREMLDQLDTFFDQERAEDLALFPRSLNAVRRLRQRLERYEFAYGQFET